MGLRRIQDPNALSAPPAMPALTGPIGYFTNGVPGTQAPTVVPDWWLNMAQEALVGPALRNGLALDGAQTLSRAVELTHGQMALFGASATWVCPAGVTRVKIRMWAGGGGGGGAAAGSSAGGGGAGGGYVEGFFDTVPGASYSIVVGAGGAAGGPGNNGSTGGVSSFGALCACTGGSPGLGAPANSFAQGGLAPGYGSGAGALQGSGGQGTSGSMQSGLYFGGDGGWAPFASGTNVGPRSGATGNAAGLAGGGSGGVNGGAGGTGGGGLCIVEY